MTKGEDTKHAILVHASQLAAQIGLGALSIGRLAKETGLSKSGLFAHFNSKEALQIQTLEYSALDFRDKVVRPAFQEKTGEARITALFENWLAWVKANALESGCLFIQSATEFDDQPGAVRDFMEEQQKLWLGGLAEAAFRAVKAGDFRHDLDCDHFAFEFYSMLLGYHNSQRMLRDPRSEDFVRRAIAGLLARSRK